MTGDNRGSPMHSEQAGVALISILLVVAITVVLSSAMMLDENLVIHKVRNNFDHGQVRQYALGGEELARQILREDYESEDKHDHLQEEWAAQGMEFEFADGEVLLQINDLQGRININTLVNPGSEGDQARTRFQVLLANAGLDAMYLDRLIDWLDNDEAVSQSGAEDYAYLGLERPYRTSGQPAVEVSELRQLLDMDANSFAVLAPYLSVLPEQRTPVNINTASAGILQSLSFRLTADIVDLLIQERDRQSGYKSVTDFLQSPHVAGLGISELGLGVQSRYFEVRVQAENLDRHGYLTSVIQRNPQDGNMRVLYRNFGRKVILKEPLEDSGENNENG